MPKLRPTGTKRWERNPEPLLAAAEWQRRNDCAVLPHHQNKSTVHLLLHPASGSSTQILVPFRNCILPTGHLFLRIKMAPINRAGHLTLSPRLLTTDNPPLCRAPNDTISSTARAKNRPPNMAFSFSSRSDGPVTRGKHPPPRSSRQLPHHTPSLAVCRPALRS